VGKRRAVDDAQDKHVNLRPPFCAYCFGELDLLRPIVTVRGRSYHPGHDELDRPLPRAGDGGGVRVGGRGGAIAVQLNRTNGAIDSWGGVG
jgi:hypothetical protein